MTRCGLMPFGGALSLPLSLSLSVKTVVVVLRTVVSSNAHSLLNLTTSSKVSANITPIKGFTATFVLTKSRKGYTVSKIERERRERE